MVAFSLTLVGGQKGGKKLTNNSPKYRVNQAGNGLNADESFFFGYCRAG